MTRRMLVIVVFAASVRADDPAAIRVAKAKERIAAIIERFSGDGEATPFCIGEFGEADYAVAVCDHKKQLHVIIGGDGGGRIFSRELQGEHLPRLFLEDLDADGKAELLVCSKHIQVFRMTDDGLEEIFQSAETFDEKPPPRVVVADLNADGRQDVAVLNYKDRNFNAPTSCLSIYLNASDLEADHHQFKLTRSGSLIFTDEHGSHATAGIAIGNFYGREQPEIVVGNDNGFLWLVELQDGVPVEKLSWKIPSGGAIGPGLAAGNLTGDEKKELLAGTNGGDIFVFQFSEDGQPRMLAKKTAGRLSYGVGATDVDGDGEEEFILTRGHYAYAGMTEHDVVWEVYKLDHNIIDRYSLERVVIKKAAGFLAPRLMLHDVDRDGTKDIVIYTAFGEGKRIHFVAPELSP